MDTANPRAKQSPFHPVFMEPGNGTHISAALQSKGPVPAARVIGGAIHYPRVPRASWRDRMLKLVDLGCNTLETYVFWNAHEPYRGGFDFSGMLDVPAFIELAGTLGLDVILRPGPYVCAEWDMGGLPSWLIGEPGMQIRCSSPPFLEAVDEWWRELIPRVAPLQASKGGPIVAMQIENEYGYFGSDVAYLQHLRDCLRSLGVEVPLFTSDGTFQRLTIANGGLPGLLRTANFGSNAAERLKVLREFEPDRPLVCMEFWVGWFDTWRNEKHITRPAAECAAELDALLQQDASAVIYMFHGGTNFGFTSGANLSDVFSPFVTSYDYDALLNECGDTTEKYDACRAVIHKHLKLDKPAHRFAPSQKKAYGPLELTRSVSLDRALSSISAPVKAPVPLTMEQLGHGQGFVLYRTQLSSLYLGEKLMLRGMHDWCTVRVDGRRVATWYRNDPQPEILLDFAGETVTVDILVHNLGRSNFGHQMCEPKGLTEGVFVGGKRHDERAIHGWTCFPIPLNDVRQVMFDQTPPTSDQAAFYCGSLQIDDEPADTFMALPTFELGCVFVNDFNIGRYWNAGPQRTLYVPAPMLRRGRNEIVVFEAAGVGSPVVVFQDIHKLQ
jgi:beta-galactosidase